MSIEIYRIQGSEGRGPFKPGFSRLWVDSTDTNRPEPAPPDFRRIHFEPGFVYGCGCRSMDQLRIWFNGTELARLRDMGFKAVRMVVDRIEFEDDFQVVFRRRRPLTQGFEIVEEPK